MRFSSRTLVVHGSNTTEPPCLLRTHRHQHGKEDVTNLIISTLINVSENDTSPKLLPLPGTPLGQLVNFLLCWLYSWPLLYQFQSSWPEPAKREGAARVILVSSSEILHARGERRGERRVLPPIWKNLCSLKLPVDVQSQAREDRPDHEASPDVEANQTERAEMGADPGHFDQSRYNPEVLHEKRAAVEVDQDLEDEKEKTTNRPLLPALGAVAYSILLSIIHKKTAISGNNLYSSWWTVLVSLCAFCRVKNMTKPNYMCISTLTMIRL